MNQNRNLSATKLLHSMYFLLIGFSFDWRILKLKYRNFSTTTKIAQIISVVIWILLMINTLKLIHWISLIKGFTIILWPAVVFYSHTDAPIDGFLSGSRNLFRMVKLQTIYSYIPVDEWRLNCEDVFKSGRDSSRWPRRQLIKIY